MTLSKSQLIDDQELYTEALVRARLRMGGGFHAREFTTGMLVWVTKINGIGSVTVHYSMSLEEFKILPEDLKSL